MHVNIFDELASIQANIPKRDIVLICNTPPLFKYPQLFRVCHEVGISIDVFLHYLLQAVLTGIELSTADSVNYGMTNPYGIKQPLPKKDSIISLSLISLDDVGLEELFMETYNDHSVVQSVLLSVEDEMVGLIEYFLPLICQRPDIAELYSLFNVVLDDENTYVTFHSYS